ncbi:MAG: RNA repair transcriptional activator RtcR [Pseudomonadota bacterium]
MKPITVIAFLGTTLDAHSGPDRWSRWRPNVAMCQHEDLLIDNLVLFHDEKNSGLADRVIRDIGHISPETRVTPHRMDLEDPWDFSTVYEALYEFARAFDFDPDAQDYLIQITTGTHVAQICLFLLTEARYLPGRLLQIAPPRRWRDGDPGSYSVIDLDLSRYDTIATRFAAERAEGTDFLKSGIETRNQAFNDMIDRIETVALRSRAPILLTGPTGAGKTQLARRIYELRHARHLIDGPFVEVNCATLRGDQAMSALFGYAKGAFTGATQDRAGLLKGADQGMLFLDEIGELGLDEQAMMLRAIEEGRFLPMGADREQTSDFVLIAGTNRDLAARVAEGAFREDLLARLDLWTFRLPGLADRREDIAPNLAYELARYADQTGQRVTINREAEDRFLAFANRADTPWSGNFRDLAAAATRMATLAPQGRITTDLVDGEIATLKTRWHTPGPGPLPDLHGLLTPDQIEEIDLFDRPQLAQVIQVCRQSPTMAEAGRRLFQASRRRRASTNDSDRLRKYLDRFGLDWAGVQTSG